MEGWVGHPLDPIGTLFSTLTESGRVGEEGSNTCLDLSGTAGLWKLASQIATKNPIHTSKCDFIIFFIHPTPFYKVIHVSVFMYLHGKISYYTQTSHENTDVFV